MESRDAFEQISARHGPRLNTGVQNTIERAILDYGNNDLGHKFQAEAAIDTRIARFAVSIEGRITSSGRRPRQVCHSSQAGRL